MSLPQVTFRTNGLDVLASTAVHSNGKGAVEIILPRTDRGDDAELRIFLRAEFDPGQGSKWRTLPGNNVLDVLLTNPAGITGMAEPIKIGRYYQRELYILVKTLTYGDKDANNSLFFVTLYLGESVILTGPQPAMAHVLTTDTSTSTHS